MNLFKKVKSIFSSHMRMERFTVEFSLLTVCLAVSIGFCLMANREKTNLNYANQVQYTTQTSTSKTNIPIDVSDVFVSNDKTKAFILLYVSDISKISANAENYQMFLRAEDFNDKSVPVTGHPSGAVYVFGTSGYIGIYLSNPSGFTPQILDLVVRCNAELVSSSGVSATHKGTSFEQYDQFRIYFNPAGNNYKTLAALNQDSVPKIESLYTQAVISANERSVRSQIYSQIEDLQTQQKAIEDYIFRVQDTDGVANLEISDMITGDDFEVKESADGSYSYVDYNPASLPAGSMFYDWRSASINGDGYIAQLDMGDKTFDEYSSELQQQADSDRTVYTIQNSDDLILEDGRRLGDLKETDTMTYNRITNDIQVLSSALQTYVNGKKNLVINLMSQLPKMENNAKFVSQFTSVNTNANALLYE